MACRNAARRYAHDVASDAARRCKVHLSHVRSSLEDMYPIAGGAHPGLHQSPGLLGVTPQAPQPLDSFHSTSDALASTERSLITKLVIVEQYALQSHINRLRLR